MRVLSIRQPWLQLILERRKTIEVRRWRPSELGEIYLHASRQPDFEACDEFGYDPSALIRGFIVARCHILGVREYGAASFVLDQNKHLNTPDRYQGPCLGWVLDKVTRVNAVKARGKLGLWNYNKPLYESLRRLPPGVIL